MIKKNTKPSILENELKMRVEENSIWFDQFSYLISLIVRVSLFLMSSSGEMLSTAGGVITRTRVTENGQEGKGQAILASENLTEVKKEKPLMVPSSFNGLSSNKNSGNNECDENDKACY